MSTKPFVNLPVKDLDRAKAFFTDLGLPFYGATADMASVVISGHTRVMPLAEPAFAGYAHHNVADATTAAEVILVVGLQTQSQVDELVDKALAAGGGAVGEPASGAGRYQRGFTDPDGHQWAALCLIQPA